MKCIRCNTQLNNDNWLQCRKNRNYKICKFCIRIENNKRYIFNKEKISIQQYNRRKEIKLSVFNYYGNCCQQCGDTNKNHLSLDHIDGNGRKQRKEILNGIDSGTAFYKWVNKNKPNNIRILCYNCNCSHNIDPSKDPKHKKHILLKIYILKKYGQKCVNCGCSNLKFLTIDHINNDGSQHRKIIGANIYSWLSQNNFPTDNFQILCFNCNYEKHFNLKS